MAEQALRMHAGQHFTGADRLAQVIVGAAFERQHLVLFAGARATLMMGKSHRTPSRRS